MTAYRAEWMIDVEAESPLEAAVKAWEAARNEDSIANVFEIRGPGPELVVVDLNSQRCRVCGEVIAYQDGMWVQAESGLMCRGTDPIDIANRLHVPQ